jgi:hypothetical protein
VALEFETALQLWHCEMRKIARWARLENGSWIALLSTMR